MIRRHTSLSLNVLAFCGFLRSNGFVVGPEEEALALRGLACVPLEEKALFKDVLRATLVRKVQQLPVFEKLFDHYWKELDKALDSKITEDARQRNQRSKPQQAPSLQALKSWLYGNKPSEETEIATYSTHESLSKRDFSTIPADELDELMQRIRMIARTLANRVNRRYQRSRNSTALFDLRNTLRKNLRRGGELLELAYRKPKKNRLKLVVLCDVSKSMDLYSSFLIQFIYAFQSVYRRIETFVFSTSLHRISAELKQQHFQTALQELSDKVVGWSGGTQIGQSLASFVQDYSRLLDKQTIVLILSDGWDTGDTDALADSMALIHQKARKVIWMNPLAGNPQYEPTVQGMQAAMPYVDIFAPAHNAESLQKIGKWL
ncbi:MAG: VWA domain-containing protein [Spirosomataceae bacterium]